MKSTPGSNATAQGQPRLAESEYPGAEEYLPSARSLLALREAARSCHGCGLWRQATQTVFGKGASSARLMLVGEQPGDLEDRTGDPFVGPAGRLLDRALADAGIPRAETYVTNAVKHFKWQPRGKRRIHAKPSASEVDACHPWLEAELQAVRPDVLVCLGATAGHALFGRGFQITRRRGVPLESPLAPLVVATVHPSAILRARGDEARHAAYALFVKDLRVAARYLVEGNPVPPR